MTMAVAPFFHRLVVVFVAIATSLAARPGVPIQIAGGTLRDLAAKARGYLDLTATDSLRLTCGKTDLRIDYRKVNTLEYGQKVSRRYAAAIVISPVLLLSKSRRHFVTLGFTDAEDKQ